MYEEDRSRFVFADRFGCDGGQLRRAPANGSYWNRYHLRAFSSKDAKGEFIGFDIDLGNEMCKRMQVKCTWVASDFDALIPSLKAKKLMPLFHRSLSPINASKKLRFPTNFTLRIHA